MAYTDDAVKAKLSALNETQEGIVTVAQWVMFHRRHAERTAQLWLQKLRDSPAPKRLNLIYLANEVAQQSRARRKEDFLIAFSPIIAEATATAYKGASNDIQQKLRRVVEVWRQRAIFEPPIQDAVEARVDEIDKSRSIGKKPPLGGSLFSSSSGSTPSELQPLVPLQVALSKATVASGASATTANAEYDKMHDPSTPLPTPPVHAARLSQLLKALANAESSVSEVIKSRIALIDGLEKLLETNRSALAKEQSLATQLSERRSETEAKKREVEDGIMRGLSAENSPAVNLEDPEGEPLTRPEVEALTPPPVEALTPVGSPKHELQEMDFAAQNHAQSHALTAGFALPGFGLTAETAQSSLQDDPNGLHPKKRKVVHEEEDYAQFASGDLDADVAELLQQESNLPK
ncbi:RNA polymerase II-binding domain-containing protein [Aspergillus pseudotamarii]|uniref:RNA polymerase II-binding domain-containing protein n=1 Tax=Aspergillus pseudotamarii TaxID=132259 RepID=A0A5N6SLN4_ASPPS|nr:RNA polymerase II-binding domain-containing protein [Aspergillus pseudotamarii]KAE8134799.1 RNA polymerase II-binding domain-containing protein [Aspergillus pseudotamarii]